MTKHTHGNSETRKNAKTKKQCEDKMRWNKIGYSPKKKWWWRRRNKVKEEFVDPKKKQ